MHHTDGNLYALERHLAEQEAYDASRDKICPDCEEVIILEDFPAHHRDDQCPDCDAVLVFLADYEPSETAQGLIPIPDAYNEA